MSNQNVGTPRFYIDYGQYWKSTGELGLAGAGWVNHGYATESQMMNLIGLNPTNMTTFPVNGVSSWGLIDYTTPYTSTEQWKLNYFAVLGHNFNSAGVRFYVETYDGIGQSGTNITEIINGDGSNNYPNMDSDGFTILSFARWDNDDNYYAIRPVMAAPNAQNANPPYEQTYTEDVQIGALSFGRYYSMPNAPDLNISMSHEYDGLKTITSKGGATLSNALYYKPPMWGSREAWQLGDWKWLSSGRRVWNLSFSYISDSDLEPTNYTGLSDGLNIGDDNWFQNVLYYTKGGHLPFIFCPDPSVAYTYDDTNGNAPTSIPEFAIARFDTNSFTREQVANNVYSMKVKIIESW